MAIDSIAPRSDLSRTRRVSDYTRGLWSRRQFVWHLATSDLKARNATTTLGVAWWVLNPLLLTGIYFFVFGIILAGGRRSNPEYLAYLMSGMFAFHFSTGAVTGGAGIILSNAKLMVNIRFPRLLLPIASVIESGIGFMVSLLVFFAIITPLTGRGLGWEFLLVVPVFLLHVLMNIGLSAISARLAVPFRDVTNFLPYLMRMWLYLSPIIWTLDMLEGRPNWVFRVIEANPMYHLLALYRTALLGYPFDSANLVFMIVFTAGVAILGISAFVRFEGKLVQHL